MIGRFDASANKMILIASGRFKASREPPSSRNQTRLVYFRAGPHQHLEELPVFFLKVLSNRNMQESVIASRVRFFMAGSSIIKS